MSALRGIQVRDQDLIQPVFGHLPAHGRVDGLRVESRAGPGVRQVVATGEVLRRLSLGSHFLDQERRVGHRPDPLRQRLDPPDLPLPALEAKEVVVAAWRRMFP